MELSSVRDTTLWKHLASGFKGTTEEALADSLAVYVKDLCSEARDRMKAMPALHPEFTLHDDVHLLRVTELMSLLLGDGSADLNPPEIALLILGAHFHDFGMVPDATERDNILASADFQRHAVIWKHNHPNYTELARTVAIPPASDRANEMAIALRTLDGAMLADYLRQTHGDRSRRYVLVPFSPSQFRAARSGRGLSAVA